MLKSIIVSSPAGSGKTERLARRYIELLQYVEPERILTITFTDKAAAEMKERIFKILKETNQEKYDLLKEKSLQLRIQTIDSFCFSLLRRFAVLHGYQPDLEVLADNDYLKELSMSDTLMQIAEQEINTPDYNNLINLIIENKFKGWQTLQRLFNNLYSARLSSQRAKLPPVHGYENLPQLIAELEQDPLTAEKISDFEFVIPKTPEQTEQLKSKITDIESIFLTKAKTPLKGRGKDKDIQYNWNVKMAEYRRIIFNLTSNFRFQNTFNLFTSRFLKEFDRLKKSSNQVDFADIEILTYEILTNHPEWSNILYLFDEHTDHILVDEFQDTSFLQWAIITKLAEEWLSGLGAKRDRGIQPTIFLVGDDKQSIYLFRNAHPEIFDRAQKHLETHLTKELYQFEQVKENYRSLKSIIDFTNHLFAKLMSPDPDRPAWQTRYKEFECKRKNVSPGIVQIILAQAQVNMPEARSIDAEMVAKKISTIIGQPIVFGKDENPRPVRFEDITILLRNRNHLDHYENALRKYETPFVVVKGIGFYNTIEISLLRAILNFLNDTNDDFSLYILLKSPLFNLSEKEILIISQVKNDNSEISLWKKFIVYSKDNVHYQSIAEKLNGWLAMVSLKPMSQIIENMLDSLNAWKIFWEPQRTNNIKKFLRIVEQLENDGAHPLLIADYFEKNLNKEESKANVNTEGRNEVKIMTVHAAKGLQFPIVFVVGLDTGLTGKGRRGADLVIDEVDENNVWVLYEPDNDLRKQSQIYINKQDKEYEEEKRLFYVAVTRARDALFLTGIDNPEGKSKNSQLEWLKEYLPITCDENNTYHISDVKIDGLTIISDKELDTEIKQKKVVISEEPVTKELHLEQLIEKPELTWQAVTKETPEIYREVRRKHGEDWITFGDILHKIFEKISNGEIKFDIKDIITEANRLFNILNVSQTAQKRLLDEIQRQFQLIQNSDIGEIIKPYSESFAELPFVLKQDKIIYSGRIDRVIIEDGVINIYDYKTFPVDEKEITEMALKYKIQLNIYKNAVSKIFTNNKVNTYLVFTAIGKIYKIVP
jgi:ATP-dependent helicase/nuclease subunit A